MSLDYSARNDRIVGDVRAGKTYLEAAEPWGISRGRAQQIAIAGGVRSSRGSKRLPEDKIQRAAALVAKDVPVEHAAVMVGLGRKSLNGALTRRGLYTRTRESRPWSANEDGVLKRDYGKRTAAQIAASLGRTRNEVIGRAYRMGLSA